MFQTKHHMDLKQPLATLRSIEGSEKNKALIKVNMLYTFILINQRVVQ